MATAVPGRPARFSDAAIPPASSRGRHGEAVGAALPGARSRAEEAPRLVIGRIDVVVVAAAAPPQPQPSARADRGFLSRNYLKRL